MKHKSQVDESRLDRFKLPEDITIGNIRYNISIVPEVTPVNPLLTNLIYNLHNNVRNVVRRYIMLKGKVSDDTLLALEEHIVELIELKDRLLVNKDIYTEYK